ncbi:YsnF/AvaK domain-containing protein [Thermithiobacillus tepidarius DSM 3134]|uniref:YsnF/AvaK domain-containing protein n=1 Tax=Thermithiobacillus tepidarius TaxID=929 RepID=UPI00042734FD|nr:YsnF/AvaK domain-containing protein [Thermithiobacillus tepidarius]
MAKTVIGFFDSRTQAESAQQDLISNGFSRSSIRLMAGEEGGREYAGQTPETHAHEGFMDRVRHFLAEIGLMSEKGASHVSESEHSLYAEGMRRGGTLLSVTTDDDSADEAADILSRHGAVDIDERATAWQADSATQTGATTASGVMGASGTTAASSATEGETRIPVIEEELKVGKREVERGGARVYSHMTETPVEEQVRLREERVDVERRPVDRPASEAELNAFQEGTMEIRTTAEEPVVSKEARVVEEVVVGKEATEHTETIRGTVRATEVEVESLTPEEAQQFAAHESEFRSDFQNVYSSRGISYEQLQPAYRYGYHLGLNPRYRGSDWSQVEPEIRRDWEAHNYGPWDRFKDAVHYAWDRARHH